MKKICFITQCSLPVPTTKGGAVETLVEYLLNENERNKDYQFTVISIGDEKAKEMSQKYKYTKFIYINPSNRFINKIRMFIYKILKHLNIYISFSGEFKKALKVLKNIDNQDYFIYEAGPTTQLPALNKIIPKERLLVHIHWDGMSNIKKDKCFSYLLPVSDYIGHQWQIGTNRSSSLIKPLYNCAKIDLFSKKITENEKLELKNKLNIPEKNKVIIFTGRIVQEKGIKELLLAYQRLSTENVTLVIIGSANFGATTNTKYEKEVSKLISQIKKQIIFTGFIHQTELYKYYNIADIAVMPSLFQDPAPLVCIETQATGTPLIATRVGGIPEYVGENTAILIDNDSNLVDNLSKEIDLLLNDQNERKSMSENSIKHAQKFNTENYYLKFNNIINEIENNK